MMGERRVCGAKCAMPPGEMNIRVYAQPHGRERERLGESTLTFVAERTVWGADGVRG